MGHSCYFGEGAIKTFVAFESDAEISRGGSYFVMLWGSDVQF